MKRVSSAVTLVPCVLLSAICVALLLKARSLCGGEFIYPIDDTYIHIAMAKNLALHGMWGVEPDKLAFCSSSPLWTLLLASLYFVFGVYELLPWFLSLGFNLATLVLVDHLIRLQTQDWRWRIGGATAVAVASPFVCTTALGMEHAMHGFFMVAALLSGAKLVSAKFRTWRGTLTAAVCAAAATGTRYESLFLLLPLGVGICGLEIWVRWKSKSSLVPGKGLTFLSAAVLPVVAYGAWAVALGGHFLPNSLLLKGSFHTMPELFNVVIQILGSVRPDCGFLYLLGFALFAAAALPNVRAYWRIAAVSTAIGICGQLVFASVGQLCRYEAFLTATGAMCLVPCAIDFVQGTADESHRMHRIGLYASMCILGLVFVHRALVNTILTPLASQNICNQQVLMTRIMAELPEEDRGCVALNDLGYMVLHGGFPVLDIWGLGSQDATECILKHPSMWDLADHELLFKKHDVKYVVVFESWFPSKLMPEGTEDVAYMKLKNNLVCGSDKVVFRATSPESVEKLRAHLLRYVDKMPPHVTLDVK